MLELAAAHPERIRRAVLLDPAIDILPHVAVFVAEHERAGRSTARPRTTPTGRRRLATPRELVLEDATQHFDGCRTDALRRRTCQPAVVSIYGELASASPPPETLRAPDAADPRTGLRARPRGAPRGLRRSRRDARRPRHAHGDLGRVRRGRRRRRAFFPRESGRRALTRRARPRACRSRSRGRAPGSPRRRRASRRAADSATISIARCASRYDSPPRTGVPTPGACSGIDDVHVEAHVQKPAAACVRAAPRACTARCPRRSTSLIVNTFASSSLQELALALVERAHADERELARPRPPAASSRRSANARRPARAPQRAPSRARFRSASVSGVLRSPCASIQMTPPGPCAAAIPTSEPSATEWSPPSTSGSLRLAAAPRATSFATRSQSSRICGRKRARSVADRESTPQPAPRRCRDRSSRRRASSRDAPRSSAYANRGRPHVDAAPPGAEIERGADQSDAAAQPVARSRRQG